MNCAIVFLAWGEKYLKQVELCIGRSPEIHGYDHVLITDPETNTEGLKCRFSEIVRARFQTEGLLRKAEIVKFLPRSYDLYLFLDSDTLVIDDMSLGFEKAAQFSIAAAPAPHYSLDYFWGFGSIMDLEGVPCKGQMQYNTGVIFFANSPTVNEILQRWMFLALTYGDKFRNDQPFFTLAMEQLGFNPYTLSISYNYRGFGDSISGPVRIWHSHGPIPEGINDFKDAWPPRRAWPSGMLYSDQKQ